MTGVLEAWSGAVGEALNELAGLRYTRLTGNVTQGQSSWPVESTFGWPSAGRFTAEGVVYHYASHTPTTLDGVTWDDPTYALPVIGRLTISGTSVQASFFTGATVRASVTGTWTGSLTLEASADGTTWRTLGTLTSNQILDAALDREFIVRAKAVAISSGAIDVGLLALPAADGLAHPVSGSFFAAGSSLSVVVLPSTVIAITLDGSWVGSLVLEQSSDGASWSTLATYPSVSGSTHQTYSAIATLSQVRLRSSTWTSGFLSASLQSSSRSGAKSDIELASVVVDISQTYSALDAQRGQFFVDTASGTALSTVGRNLGVLRQPDLDLDDAFRKVIRTLAYAPKGTMYGLEMALTAFFGAGNFRVWEDFPSEKRNTVFIQLLNGIDLFSTAQGRAYLQISAAVPLDAPSKTLTLPAVGASPTSDGPVLAVTGIRLADEGRYDRLAAALPSALTEVPYPGASPVPLWAYSGTTEATVASASASTGLTITTSAGQTALYSRTARIRPESDAEFSCSVSISAADGTGSTSGRQWLMAICDGARDLAVGVIVSGGAAQFNFIDTATGSFLPSASGIAPVVPLGTQAHLSLRKAASRVELWVNGSRSVYDDASNFAVASTNDYRFGHQDSARSVTVNYRDLGFSAVTRTDYWNISGASGVVSGAGGNGINTASGLVVPGDVGKPFRTRSSSVSKNSGEWVVDTAPDANNVTLSGALHAGATVESIAPTGPHRVTLSNTSDLFRYPDDVGKKFEISGSALGNDGTYVVQQLMRVDSLGAIVPWGTPDPGDAVFSPIPPGETVIVELATAPAGGFKTEANCSWRLLPSWDAPDASVEWTLVDAGTYAGRVLTLRAIPPLDIPAGYVVVLRASYTTLYSAQLLANSDTSNVPAGVWHPLYLPSSPFGPYGRYIDDLTKAGVVPELVAG